MLIITRRSVAVGGRLKLPSPLHTIINNLQLCSENVVRFGLCESYSNHKLTFVTLICNLTA